MALQAIFNWENQDATSDLNERFRSLFTKGCITGGHLIPVSGQLQIDITPSQTVSFDGMLVSDSSTQRVAIPPNQTSIITIYAKHNIGAPATVEYQVYEMSTFNGLANKDDHIILGAATTSALDTEVLTSNISYALREEQSRLSRNYFRGWLLSSTLLPVDNFNKSGDFYIVNQGIGDIPYLYAWNGLAWVNISDTLALNAILAQHRANMYTNEVHLNDDQSDAALGSSGAPSVVNRYVTETDSRLANQNENDAMEGSNGTPSATNKFITEEYPVTYPTTFDFFIPPSGAIQISGAIFIGSGSSAVNYFSVMDYIINRGYINNLNSPVTITGVFKDPLTLVPLVPSVDADQYGYFNGTLYLTTDNIISSSFKVLYGAKSTLKTILRDFNFKPTPAVDATGSVVISKIAKIKGRDYDEDIPVRENNKSLRHSVDNVMAYLGSVLETDVVAGDEDYTRLSNEPVVGQEFVKNEGINDVTTFDNVTAIPYTYTSATGTILFASPVDLSGVTTGNIFMDGQGVAYPVSSIGINSLVIMDRNTGTFPLSINNALPSGTVKVDFNPRDLLLSEVKFNFGYDVFPVSKVSVIESEFSKPDGYIASGIKNSDNRLDPRVIFYGGFENYVNSEREQYVRNASSVGIIEITGFFTNVILCIRRRPNSPSLSVTVNGSPASTIVTNASGNISTAQTGFGFKCHRVMLASGLSNSSPSTIVATIIPSADPLDIFAIEVGRASTFSTGLLESGIVFRATELLKRSSLTNVTIPLMDVKARGGRTLIAVDEEGNDFSYLALSDLDSGGFPAGQVDALNGSILSIPIVSSGGKLNGYKVNDIIGISTTTTTVLRRIQSVVITPLVGTITLWDNSTLPLGSVINLTHICSTDSTISNIEEDEIVRYNLFRDFVQHTLSDFENPNLIDRYVAHQDGLTVIAGKNISITSSGIAGTQVSAKIDSLGDLRITALCTRLDIITSNINNATAKISIDGSNPYDFSFNGIGTKRHTIMSNARYQSHEIIINNTNGELCLSDLILFAPQKQDFLTYKNVVADLMYLARYVSSDTFMLNNKHPLGAAFFEANVNISYIEGIGGTTDWVNVTDFSMAQYGNYIWTDRPNAKAEFWFLGDAFELQYIMGQTHGTFTISVDGISLSAIVGTVVGTYGLFVDSQSFLPNRANIGAYGLNYGYHKVEATLLTGRMAFNGYYVGNNLGAMTLGLNNNGVYTSSVDTRNFIPIIEKPVKNTIVIPTIRANEVDLAIGSSSVSVTFNTPMPDINYVISPTIVTSNSMPIYFPINIIARDRFGFTAKWNAALPDNTYKLAYTAVNKM